MTHNSGCSRNLYGAFTPAFRLTATCHTLCSQVLQCDLKDERGWGMP